MEQLVEKPTRHWAGQQSSLLDLIITNEPDCICEIVHEAPFGKSDHEVLTFTVLNGHHKNETQREKLNFNEIDLKSFRPPIQNVSWNERIHREGVMRAYTMFAETVTQAIEVSVPTYTVQERRKAPWSTRGNEKIAKKKRNCWHRYKYKEFDQESPECAQ